MVEHGVDVPSEFGHLHQLGPIEQEIVIVEDVLFLLGFDIGFEQAAEILLEGNAPWKVPLQDVIESLTGVDGLQIDSKAGRRQFDPEFNLDQLADRRTRPQRELHFQLLGPLFHDQLLNVSLLIGRRFPAFPAFLAPVFRLDGRKTAMLLLSAALHFFAAGSCFWRRLGPRTSTPRLAPRRRSPGSLHRFEKAGRTSTSGFGPIPVSAARS